MTLCSSSKLSLIEKPPCCQCARAPMMQEIVRNKLRMRNAILRNHLNGLQLAGYKASWEDFSILVGYFDLVPRAFPYKKFRGTLSVLDLVKS